MDPMPRPLLALSVVALTLSLLSACSGRDAVRQDVAGSNGYQSGDAALRWVSAGDRTTVTGVRGELLDGRHFDLDDWRGRVVVVNFWGQWCAPCQAEADALQQVYADNRAKGVEFLGVDIRDNRASA